MTADEPMEATAELTQDDRYFRRRSAKRRLAGLLVSEDIQRCFFCRRRATMHVDRVDAKTGQLVSRPWCGRC